MATRSATDAELERAAATLPVVLYDGACRFCSRQALSVRRLAAGRVHVRPLQEALADLPWVDPDEAVLALTLVRRDGRTLSGAQAIVELLRLARPLLGALASFYYLPGVRQLADQGYRAVAARRYALFGRTPDHRPCDAGACGVPWRERAARPR
jgi:predicted DCC family thiol-disulfide oxidoreductase YuxK